MGSRKAAYRSAYGRAKDERDIAWHHEEIPPILKSAVERLGGKGRVLDIGCGTGVHAVFMARQGLEVTAIDFIPEALAMAGRKAAAAGVEVDFLQSDITTRDAPEKYDFILDSGCLHNLSGRSRASYKARVPGWLSEGASLVLVHFGKRGLLDLNPVGLKIKRKTRDAIERFFLPELELREFAPGEGRRPLFYYRFTWKQPRG